MNEIQIGYALRRKTDGFFYTGERFKGLSDERNHNDFLIRAKLFGSIPTAMNRLRTDSEKYDFDYEELYEIIPVACKIIKVEM